MQDSRDHQTGNLLTTPGAKRQAALKARREAAGFKRTTVWIKQADYEAGRNAAGFGSTTASDCPKGRDRLSWMLGYCETLEKAAKAREKALEQQKGGR